MASLKPSSSNSSEESNFPSVSFLSSLSYDGAVPRSTSSNHSWDVAASCRPLLQTFHYLSSKLAFQGLHVAIIVLGSRPELLSAWPIDIHTQQFLRKLIARADIKYSLDQSWVTALNDLCKPVDSSEAFEKYRGTTYLIHRSLLQKDIIYSGDGLTVLAVDYVFKFKEMLQSLAQEDTFPLFRDDCKESCVELLKHIHGIYKDVPLSKAYLRRSYTYFTLREDIVDEVCEAYFARYGTTGVFDSPSTNHTEKTLQRREKPIIIVDQMQDSPRKFPAPARKLKQHNTFAARSGLHGLKKSYTDPGLGSPIEFDPFFNRPHTNGIERPRSPKGELFESPRSPPITPPKPARNHHSIMSPYTGTGIPAITRSDGPSDSAFADSASTFSSKKKKFFASWANISRSGSMSKSLKNQISSRNSSFEMARHPVPSLVQGPRPPPPSMSRCSSIKHNGVSFDVDKVDIIDPSSQSQGPTTYRHEIEHNTTTFSGRMASDSKFGWLHVMKRGNGGWGMPLSQRVL